MIANKIYTGIRDSSKQINSWIKRKILLSNEVNDESVDLDTITTLPENTLRNNNLTDTALKKQEPVIINPNNKAFYYWLIIFTLCYAYNLTFLIARMVFWELQEIESYFVWLILDYGISDVVYLTDIFIQFRTGYMENGELCRDLKQIKTKYIRSFNMKIDIISIFPTDLFYFLLPNNFKRFLPALRMNRLLKILRFKEFLTITETQTSSPNVFRLTTVIMNLLMLFHWNACIFFFISYLIGFGSDPWVYPALTNSFQMLNLTDAQIYNKLWTHQLSTQYIYCLWWSVLSLTTIAEITFPTYSFEFIYTSFLFLFGIIVIAILVGSTSDMFSNANSQRDSLQEKVDSVKEFLRTHNIEDQFGSRIQTYFDYLWASPTLDQQDNVLECLPSKLFDEIAMNINMETLKRVAIFQDCEPGLLRELVSKLKSTLFSPGDYVCHKGDIGRCMYFIKMGKLEVVNDNGSQVFATLNAGAAFGEISILEIPGNKNGNKRTANIRSVGFSDLFQLTKDDLWDVLSEYPIAKRILLEKGKSLLRKDNLIDEEIAEKVERRSQPVYMQVGNFEQEIAKFNLKLNEGMQTYVHFLSKTKQRLTYLENTFKYK